MAYGKEHDEVKFYPEKNRPRGTITAKFGGAHAYNGQTCEVVSRHHDALSGAVTGYSVIPDEGLKFREGSQMTALPVYIGEIESSDPRLNMEL